MGNYEQSCAILSKTKHDKEQQALDGSKHAVKFYRPPRLVNSE